MNDQHNPQAQASNIDYGAYSSFHQLDVKASAGSLWKEIENFNDWPGWNPLYVEADGEFIEGARVRFTVSIPGMSPQKGQATVISVVPGQSVHYQMRSMGGLSLATRFIELHPHADGSCSIVNGERMGGLLAPLLYRVFGGKICQGLQGMNEALKRRLENNTELKGSEAG